ncbi:spore coat protein CotJB [Clostridium sp. MB40-C1]|uniref:spore coat protein CotJB n=1 Tax=Clostridium sp. MB40-C1 TaxID=3070996 RepID=UPI0027E1EC0C|nr:spore coat protein CotJB [Clostridium sp. MB40-C1]WMJ80172.1 spore coat protein CotJB [Clostridium sp. MB40-C1]
MSKNMSKMELLKQITALNFVVEDLGLYLNTHPMDQQALAKYNLYVMQYKALKQNYELCHGMLSQNGQSPYPWQWINEPWPWEYEANFEFEREER